MNIHERSNDYQPDEENAHYVALNKMREEDREQGDLACADYVIEYDREMGAFRQAPPALLSTVLDKLPTIGDSPQVAQYLLDHYQANGLDMPEGMYELPLQWAKAFYELIHETHWPEHRNSTIRDVFGWNLVLRYGGYLHIRFENPLPHKGAHWNEVGAFVLELHRRFEPGIYTPPGRLIEFL